MQSDISKKIDDLVGMAGSSANIDTLQAELLEIEKESSRLKEELALLKNVNPEEKYFKASDKQVDENIKVSLEAKIKKVTKKLRDVQQEIDSVTKDEEASHQTIIQLKNDIKSSSDYVTSLNDRISEMEESPAIENFKKILDDENKKISELITALKKEEENDKALLDKLDYLSLAKEEIIKKLKTDKEQLSDIKSSLMNPTSYIDEDLEKFDEEKIEEIQKQLSSLDKRRIEIITDPGMIAIEAKKLIEEDDRTSALSKMKELITLVKLNPFMDIPSSSDLESVLQEELNNASKARDEFASLIDSKDYTKIDTHVITNRINFLQNEITNLENKIKSLQEEINLIDNDEFNELMHNLEDATNLCHQLEQNIVEYEQVMASEEEKTPKRRAVLSSAFTKKQADLEVVKKIIENYKEDQKELIEKAHNLQIIEIKQYQKRIEKLQEEVNKLNKLLTSESKAKDVLAIESDKRKLKALDETVKQIKHRQKYTTTPTEIFDEIEIYLGTIEDEEPKENLKENSEVLENDQAITEEKLNELSTEEVMEELPEIDDVIDTKNKTPERLKVIDVEPINTESSKEDNPFIIAEYDDDDFVDVNSLFDGNGVL